IRQFLGASIIPLLILRNNPTLRLALLIPTFVMYADPEEYPEERLQIMYEGVRLTKQSTNRYEDLGSSPIW
ncbi:MAG: hypothetical protein Q9217_006480, partial [Psora testacea]